MIVSYRSRAFLKIMLIAVLASITMISEVRADGITRGTVTNLPLPRFVSIGASKANVRRGPSLSYRINWVYQRNGLPVMITAEYGHWRRVVDNDGKGGWIHYVLLSGRRTAIVERAVAPMRVLPNRDAPKVAVLEQDVVAQIDECTRAWCWLEANGYEGWVARERLWGVELDEIIE